MAFDFFAFDAGAATAFGSFGASLDTEELLRLLWSCELLESESELDELVSESLELPDDDEEPELEQLESVEVAD